MKRIYWLIALTTLFIWGGCSNDNKNYYAGNFADPVLSAPSAGATITLTEEHSNDSLSFSWKKAEFGFPAAVIYTVQAAMAGTNFASPVKITETKNLSASIDYATLNNSLLIAGLVPETPAKVEFRVMASVSENLETLNSEPTEVTVTAYNVTVSYPILFVPGSYQNWTPSDSSTIVTSPKADGIYEGYFYFPANTEFKFTKQPDWDPLNWGDGGNNKLSPGAGNIKVPNAGLYKVTADLNKLTYSIIPVSWSLNGSATSNTPISLAIDNTKKLLEVTANLSAGGFIFKETGAGNRTLGLYFGNQLMDDGTEIIVPQAGRYTITLDLGKYPYTFMIKD